MSKERPQSFGPGFSLGSPYGDRVDPINPGTRRFHSGQDYPARAGTPIPAAANGTVVYSGFNAKSGNTVIVHNDLGGFSVYAHMQNDAPLAQLDQKLFQGDIVGHVGSTGARAKGNHLHYSVLPEWLLHHIPHSNNGGPLSFELNKQNTKYPAHIDQALPYRQPYLQYLDRIGGNGASNASSGTSGNPQLLGGLPTAGTPPFGPSLERNEKNTGFAAPIDQSLPYAQQYLQYLLLTGTNGASNTSLATTGTPQL